MAGIFEGADARKAAYLNKTQRKRKSFAVSPAEATRSSLAMPCLYPLMGVRLKTLLELDIVLPHQKMLEDELLVEWNDSYRGRSVFVSHEWCGFNHADPAGQQLQTLQSALRRLMAGDMEVNTDGEGKTVYLERVTGEEWQSALSDGDAFIFYDYMSVPQPSAGPMPMSEFDEENAGHTPETADHRFGSSHVVECLNRAVQSIPSYIERSDVVLVLTPTIPHQDRDNYTLDFSTWRSRGWCRLEMVSAVLARKQPRVMLVKSATSVAFMRTISQFSSPVGEGNLTCCHREHNFGGGPNTVPCDKHKILPVLEALLEAKLGLLRSQGEKSLLDYRSFEFQREVILKGMDMAAPMQRGLAALKARLRWSEYGQAAEDALAERTGISLLLLAVWVGDEDAVRTLLRDGDKDRLCLDANRRVNAGRLDLGFRTGDCPLHVALSNRHISFDIAEMLIDAGADPYVSYTHGHGSASCLAVISRMGNPPENVARWMKKVPDFVPDYDYSQPPMTYAALQGRERAFLEALIAVGCDPTRPQQAGYTPLMNAVWDDSAYPGCPADALRYLLSLPRVRAQINARCKPFARVHRRAYWKARLRARLLGDSSANTRRLAWQEGATALHFAVRYGNDEGVRQLLAAGADPTIKNKMGMTAAASARWQSGGDLPPLVEKALRATTK